MQCTTKGMRQSLSIPIRLCGPALVCEGVNMSVSLCFRNQIFSAEERLTTTAYKPYMLGYHCLFSDSYACNKIRDYLHLPGVSNSGTTLMALSAAYSIRFCMSSGVYICAREYAP